MTMTPAQAAYEATPDPCPWPDCQSSRIGHTYLKLEENEAQAVVECFDCGCRGPASATYRHADQLVCEAVAKRYATAAWNTRSAAAPDLATPAIVEQPTAADEGDGA